MGCGASSECTTLRERVAASSRHLDDLSQQLQNAHEDRKLLEQRLEKQLAEMRNAHQAELDRMQDVIQRLEAEKQEKDQQFAKLQEAFLKFQEEHRKIIQQATTDFQKILDKKDKDHREDLNRQMINFKEIIFKIQTDNDKKFQELAEANKMILQQNQQMMKQIRDMFEKNKEETKLFIEENRRQTKLFAETITNITRENAKTHQQTQTLMERMLDRMDKMDQRDNERLIGKQLYQMVMQEKKKMNRKYMMEPIHFVKLTPVLTAAYAVLDAVASFGGANARVA